MTETATISILKFLNEFNFTYFLTVSVLRQQAIAAQVRQAQNKLKTPLFVDFQIKKVKNINTTYWKFSDGEHILTLALKYSLISAAQAFFQRWKNELVANYAGSFLAQIECLDDENLYAKLEKWAETANLPVDVKVIFVKSAKFLVAVRILTADVEFLITLSVVNKNAVAEADAEEEIFDEEAFDKEFAEADAGADAGAIEHDDIMVHNDFTEDTSTENSESEEFADSSFDEDDYDDDYAEYVDSYESEDD